MDSAKGAYSEPLLSSGHTEATVSVFTHRNMLTPSSPYIPLKTGDSANRCFSRIPRVQKSLLPH